MQRVMFVSKDANIPLPEDPLHLLMEGINGLPQDPRTDYLRSEILSKFVSHETDSALVRRTRAINKWLATERQNEATNVRLLTCDPDYQILNRVTFSTFVSKTREIVRRIIGDTPDPDALIGIYSGGASTSRKRTESHPALKYLGKADVTQEALPWWELIAPDMCGWTGRVRLDHQVVRGNVLFTVPKKTDIDRCACKEPDLNMFMQKGIGGLIRRCLRREGIDLNDQSRNRALAREGSRSGSLATLDLSSASDSVTIELVALLLPEVWFTCLNSLRCAVTLIDGDEHRNEMFSSMGNGFTFELESLLFYALARATAYFEGVSGVISVYGDDIISPSALAPDLVRVLSFFGFEINESKSFWTGNFRESCGGHYINGCDVTPFYIRRPISRLTDLILTANNLRRWATFEGQVILDPYVYPIWEKLRNLVPESLWGGRDTSNKLALVTGHSPRGVLSEKVKRVSTRDGGYYHWLNITRRRVTSGEVSTSTRSIGSGSYRIRPNRVVNSTIPLFYEEV